tara:strand:- start:1349 stop:1564 length:216 start_codon:yes stop_codon:yes gene_type:complete
MSEFTYYKYISTLNFLRYFKVNEKTDNYEWAGDEEGWSKGINTFSWLKKSTIYKGELVVISEDQYILECIQ